MPRKKSGDDETPRRRRGAAAAAAEPERSLWLRILLYSPKDMVAGLIAFAACSAIVTNALFLQSGPHPAPMFGSVVTPPSAFAVNPMPRPRPAEADAIAQDSKAAEPKLGESRLFDPKPEPRAVESRAAEPKAVEPQPAESRPVERRSADQRSSDPLANLVKATTQASPPPTNVLRPPAPIPVPITGARRVAAVQRVLTEYGYGQLKPTGTVGPDTRVAIEKFERERRLPVTGQVSERLVRELAAVTGHAVE
ncbi:peptidoglycan-binding domain-containing protein [Bradyrhizobium sp. ARR65]|uniref:peptidoglycan-binding domain-containing protein n=1 Tax=Bradyrhizobium sp. ARR65 TaxID=1040989 RepID=UPI0004666934|nr:peptidoglycan-binding domain-containing protein [Bradyrhizobium sp. ARR65]